MAAIIDFVVSRRVVFRRTEAAVRVERCALLPEGPAAAGLSANWHLDPEGRLVCSWHAARP